MTSFFLLLALAFAGDPAPLPATGSGVVAFEVGLDQARAAWFQGDVEVARAGFQALYGQLLAGTDVPLESAGEVAIYVGEIAYEGGDLPAAEAAWTWLLQRDPDHPISPYHHPIDVIGLFESVRSRVKAEIAALPIPLPPRYPAWGWLPLGVPQFKQRQPIAGATLLVTQAVLASASVGFYLDLTATNPDIGDPAPDGRGTGGPLTERTRINKFRYQWPSTFGFYTLWAISTTAGQTRWRNHHPAPRPTLLVDPAAGVTPARLPSLPMVVVSGRF